MKTRFSLALTALLFLVAMACGLTVELATPHPAPCLIDSLLSTVDLFPGARWEETGSRSVNGAPSRIGIERAGTSFSATIGGANHQVYRFVNDSAAYKAYEGEARSWFGLSLFSGGSDWNIPEDLVEFVPGTEDYHLGCSSETPDDLEDCQFIARYGTYVIRFSADMQVMDYQDLLGILENLDTRMAACQ